MAQLHEVVEALIKKTQKGEIHWARRNEQSNMWVTQINGIEFTIGPQGNVHMKKDEQSWSLGRDQQAAELTGKLNWDMDVTQKPGVEEALQMAWKAIWKKPDKHQEHHEAVLKLLQKQDKRIELLENKWTQ